MGYTDLTPQHPSHSQAYCFLRDENPNENKSSPLNLEGKEKRKVAFNGGMGQAQLEWMRSCLDECVRLGQYAVICSHVAFHPKAAHPSALVWNQEEVLDIVHEYRACIVGCLHGHDHDGGHFIDDDGQCWRVE
jgi:manganese-dependent ADP-ribose/CDP-alcohol diphosphatase